MCCSALPFSFPPGKPRKKTTYLSGSQVPHLRAMRHTRNDLIRGSTQPSTQYTGSAHSGGCCGGFLLQQSYLCNRNGRNPIPTVVFFPPLFSSHAWLLSICFSELKLFDFTLRPSPHLLQGVQNFYRWMPAQPCKYTWSS